MSKLTGLFGMAKKDLNSRKWTGMHDKIQVEKTKGLKIKKRKGCK